MTRTHSSLRAWVAKRMTMKNLILILLVGIHDIDGPEVYRSSGTEEDPPNKNQAPCRSQSSSNDKIHKGPVLKKKIPPTKRIRRASNFAVKDNIELSEHSNEMIVSN